MKIVEALARATGFRPWVVIAAGIVLLLGAGLLGKCAYDRAIVDRAVTKANNTTLQRTIGANDAAAREQLSDQQTTSDIKRSFDDAIHNPPPGASADARVRVDCVRLRNAGYREADLPAICGHAGGSGTGP